MKYPDNIYQSSAKWVCENEICIIKYWYSRVVKKWKLWCLMHLIFKQYAKRSKKIWIFLYNCFFTIVFYFTNANDTIWNFWSDWQSNIMMRDLVDCVYNFELFAFVRQQKSTLLIQHIWFLISEPTLILSDSFILFYMSNKKKIQLWIAMNRIWMVVQSCFDTVFYWCLM